MAILCPQAHAVYDRPVTWSDMSVLDLRPVLRSQYASNSNLLDPVIPSSALEVALRDADAKISPEFRVPDSLRPATEFWFRIYTEFTTQHIVLFDEHHPELIYEILDHRDLAKKARSRMNFEANEQRLIHATLNRYRKAFRHLAKNPNPARPSPEESRILSAVRKCPHKHPLRFFADGLRIQRGQRDNVVKGLLAAETYFPKMEQIFASIGTPPELTRISLVESSFNMNAISRAGAAGVWQFMHASALEYMTVDKRRRLDERLSPLKSGIAAARLLKRNQKILKSWPLAVTAYNHGLVSLVRLRKTDRQPPNLWKIYDLCNKRSPLGWASRNYYSEFLAILHAEAYRHLFYGEIPLAPNHDVGFFRLTRAQSGLDLAIEKGVSLHEFRLFNPDIRDLKQTLPKGFRVVLPGLTDDQASLENRQRPPHSGPMTLTTPGSATNRRDHRDRPS